MEKHKFIITVKPKEKLTFFEINGIIDFCSQAFEEEYSPYYLTYIDPIHVLGKLDGELVSHALWITRYLQIRDQSVLRTAYIEGVATDGAHRRKGYASALMERVAKEISEYDIGCLCPADTTLYSRLGWEYWQGTLYARKGGKLIEFPVDCAMILRTPNTPDLDISAALSIEWREKEVW
jgi:aminoglycoside 2'-N-acetyltransferase I